MQYWFLYYLFMLKLCDNLNVSSLNLKSIHWPFFGFFSRLWYRLNTLRMVSLPPVLFSILARWNSQTLIHMTIKKPQDISPNKESWGKEGTDNRNDKKKSHFTWMRHHEEEEMMQLRNSAIYKQGRWIFHLNNTGVYAHQIHHATNSAHVCNADWLTTCV